MSSFEEQLWSNLVLEHGAELAVQRRPARARHRTRPLMLTGTAAGLAATATVLAVSLTATTAPPAFAVTYGSDGTITVILRQVAGISGLNEALARRGIRARAVPVVHGCGATPTIAPGENYLLGNPPGPNVADSSETIYPSRIPKNDTLVLAVKSLGRDRIETVEGLVRGQAPSCAGDTFVTTLSTSGATPTSQ